MRLGSFSAGKNWPLPPTCMITLLFVFYNLLSDLTEGYDFVFMIERTLKQGLRTIPPKQRALAFFFFGLLGWTLFARLL